MKDLVSHVEQAVLTRRLLKRGQSLLLGVSGGLDSMVLLDILHRLADRHGWKLVVGHFNHQLRGQESDGDERLVRRTAGQLGLRFLAGSGDVKALAHRERVSLEMAARQLRHQFFHRAAREQGIRRVALAHHANDQIELFFLRLVRGAGGEGLGGMKWQAPAPFDRQVTLIRPLLDVNKADLSAYAKARGLTFREDSSNSSLQPLRNRIRHKLIPVIRRQFGIAAPQTILRTMEIIGAENRFVEDTARDWLDQCSRTDFASLPVAVQRQCLLLQLRELDLVLDFERVESLRFFPDESVAVSPDCTVVRNAKGEVQCRRSQETEMDSAELMVRFAGRPKVANFGGLKISWSIEGPDRCAAGIPSMPGCEYFDAAKIGSGVHLRHWRAGDRYQPIGMACEVKLQDVFTNRKVPRSRRHQLVVATTVDGRIFWVEKLRISEQFKLDKHTTHRLKWQWRRQSPGAL